MSKDYGKTLIGDSVTHPNPEPQPGWTVWIENGNWFTAPEVSTAFGGHAYDDGGYEMGIRDCPCGCHMLSDRSWGPVDPFGPCPENPKLKHSREESAVSVVGFLITIGLVVGIVCGLLYVGGKLLDAGKTIQERRDSQLTNEMGDFRAAGGAPDPVIERLLAMPEEVLVPSERMEFANDAEFFAWADSLRTWVILYRETLADPWVDSGNRLYGASNEVRAVLLDLCRWEGVWAGRGMTKDGRWRTCGFYRQVEEEGE